MKTNERWSVVGGGILGMTLALRLRERGHDVTIIESAPSLGGLASAWQIGNVVWDRHYHVTLLSDIHLRSLLDDLGLTDHLEWVETRTGVFADGEIHSVSNSAEFLRFPGLGIVDKARLAWTILYASRIEDWKRLERMTVEDWLVRNSGRRAFETFWKPLLRSKLGDSYQITSAAFIWATIRRLYAARRTGLKKEMFGYVHGGYATVLDCFSARLEELGIRVIVGTRVDQVVRNGDQISVTLGSDLLEFDKVVVTTASPVAAHIIGGLSNLEAERLYGITYQGILCASLLVDRPFSQFYVTNLTESGLPFTGVIEMTALIDPSELAGNNLLYLPKYVASDDPALSWSNEEIRERFLAGLQKMKPEFDPSSVNAFEVSRVRYVLPLPTVGYSEAVPTFGTSIPGLFTVNSAQILNGTLNVNETLQLAARALPVLLGDETESPTTLESEVTPVSSPPRLTSL